MLVVLALVLVLPLSVIGQDAIPCECYMELYSGCILDMNSIVACFCSLSIQTAYLFH